MTRKLEYKAKTCKHFIYETKPRKTKTELLNAVISRVAIAVNKLSRRRKNRDTSMNQS